MEPFVPTLEQAERIITQTGQTPIYVTDKQNLSHKARLFRDAFGPGVKIFYALKANYNPAIVLALKEAGIDGLDTVSPYEVLLGKKLGFTSEELLFTGNGCSNDELRQIHEQGVISNLGSLSELKRFGDMFPDAPCAIRLNVDVGDGECAFVVTGGEDTKFGISDCDIGTAKDLIAKYNLTLIGIHGHIGSGFYQKESFVAGVEGILGRAKGFDAPLKFIDFGGGFGIRYHLQKEAINLKNWAGAVQHKLDDFAKTMPEDFHYRLEPGKFLVGESTCLLARVTMVKPERKTTFVGIDTGFNHLIRPTLYGSYHQIINLSATREKRGEKQVTVVGNVCESGDIFGDNIILPNPEEGDILAILSAGAYCQSMSSLYQLRPPASEVMVDGNNINIIRAPMSFENLAEFIAS
ncbi:MAG: diaminopimelate decarboxylase [Alphaproteobacteria bacterium]|nr:diaminopimelate decarboxylase [Alphaproteobacteria bacterium]